MSDTAGGALLELKELVYAVDKDGEPLRLMDRVSLKVPAAHFMAVVGPSGCGKSTLLKLITGLWLEDEGELYWQGEDLNEDGEMDPTDLGYVPQFSIAHEHLTVEESVEHALRLRAVTDNQDAFYDRVDQVISEVGLQTLRDQYVQVLSGGQRRRLGLAMELVSKPALLLCDEVTSGLDAKSEEEIVKLMHDLSRHENRAVLNVTHSLAHMELYDSVLVLHQGCVAYHGPASSLTHYFSVASVAEIYPRLAERQGSEWHESWLKRKDAYYAKMLAAAPPQKQKPAADLEQTDQAEPEEEGELLPSAFSQFTALLTTRLRLFFRDRTQLLLQLALLVIFPVLVIIFAPSGLEAFPDEVADPSLNIIEQARQTAITEEKQTKLGALVSGLVMFQVILLTLMGSNNAAREIAGERLIYEKLKLSGVRPGSYLASKLVFLGLLVCVQSSIMAHVVHMFCQLPGSFATTWKLLLLVNGGMTAVCLGISAHMRSADQASLLSVYLVGFQLPLSGAILKLPGWLEPIVQPTIAAYWSWAGQLKSVADTASPYFQGIQQAIPTFPLPEVSTSTTALLGHVTLGILLTWFGCRRLLLPRD